MLHINVRNFVPSGATSTTLFWHLAQLQMLSACIVQPIWTLGAVQPIWETLGAVQPIKDLQWRLSSLEKPLLKIQSFWSLFFNRNRFLFRDISIENGSQKSIFNRRLILSKKSIVLLNFFNRGCFGLSRARNPAGYLIVKLRDIEKVGRVRHMHFKMLSLFSIAPWQGP